MKISKDMELNNVIYSKSMDILRSNNSSDTEGLCVISVSNRHLLDCWQSVGGIDYV